MTLGKRVVTTVTDAVQTIRDYVTGAVKASTSADRPEPPVRRPEFGLTEEVLGELVTSLREVVAWQMYQHGMPLDHVKAADPSGRVTAAIEALAADLLAQQEAAEKDAAAQAKERFVPEHGPDWQADAVYYDRIRRLRDALGLPSDELQDLDQLASEMGWTPESVAQDVAARGLE